MGVLNNGLKLFLERKVSSENGGIDFKVELEKLKEIKNTMYTIDFLKLSKSIVTNSVHLKFPAHSCGSRQSVQVRSNSPCSFRVPQVVAS
jgi:hypothetical protein